MKLGEVAKRILPKRIIALTATATKRVQDDICSSLNIPNAKRFVKGVYRPNLQLAAEHGFGRSRPEAIRMVVLGSLECGNKTGIIYAPTRKDAEGICTYLKERGVKALFYHAGLNATQRTATQNQWAQNGGVIVATLAFGMGIDRPDVSFVIHSGLSSSIEDLYQEIGRAGRDGREALCITFWDSAWDYQTQMFLINKTNPSGQEVKVFWTWMSSLALEKAKPGADTATINMTQEAMGDISGCDSVSGCISFLKKRGLVKKVVNGVYEVSLRTVELDYSSLDEIRADKVRKLDEIVAFYRSKECRMALICAHFGDMSLTGKCGVCDNCTSPD
jgi:ATP-dependent DNA helicase RecQ